MQFDWFCRVVSVYVSTCFVSSGEAAKMWDPFASSCSLEYTFRFLGYICSKLCCCRFCTAVSHVYSLLIHNKNMYMSIDKRLKTKKRKIRIYIVIERYLSSQFLLDEVIYIHMCVCVYNVNCSSLVVINWMKVLFF